MGDDPGDGQLGRTTGRTVLFVCPHGAGKSRIAAAWFNSAAPPGWQATSAGLSPQATVSEHAGRLLAGTPAEGLLDGALPRPLSAVADPDLIVAIDCRPGEVPGALAWALTNQRFDAELAAELRQRAQALARTLASATRSTSSTGPAIERVVP